MEKKSAWLVMQYYCNREDDPDYFKQGETYLAVCQDEDSAISIADSIEHPENHPDAILCWEDNGWWKYDNYDIPEAVFYSKDARKVFAVVYEDHIDVYAYFIHKVPFVAKEV